MAMAMVAFTFQTPEGDVRTKRLNVAKKRAGQPLFIVAQRLKDGRWDVSVEVTAYTREEAEAKAAARREKDREFNERYGYDLFQHAVLPLTEVPK